MLRERDWTPAVLVTSTVCFATVVMVSLTTPWLRGVFDPEPGPQRDRRLPPAEIAAWVGDLGPGLKVLLTPVWGDPEQDLFHDGEINRSLALSDGRGLAYYRLIAFNVSSDESTLLLPDGALAIHAAGSEEPVALRSLASMLGRGEVSPTAGMRSVLEGLGALRTEVRIPPGGAVNLLVPFPRRVDLADATSVVSRDGAEFRRRPMPRAELQDLLEGAPDEQRVKDL